jgi:hypothetical protein
MSTSSPPPSATAPGRAPASTHLPSGGKGSALKRAKRAFWVFVIGSLLLFAAYTWAMLRFSYSKGERAGYVQKFSYKGWVCKTWEGELAMATLPGSMPEVFPFTVWDDAVAARINAHMGQRVVLHYQEKVGLPTSCFGETRHIVDDVKSVGAP